MTLEQQNALRFIAKYVADGSLDMSGAAEFFYGWKHYGHVLVRLEPYIDNGVVNLEDLIPDEQKNIALTGSPLLIALSIPAIWTFFETGRFTYQELRDAFISQNRQFSVISVMGKRPNFWPTAAPKTRWFSFAEVVSCPFVQAELKNELKLSELTRLSDDGVCLLFDKSIRSGLEDGTRKLMDVIKPYMTVPPQVPPEVPPQVLPKPSQVPQKKADPPQVLPKGSPQEPSKVQSKVQSKKDEGCIIS